MAVGYSDWSDRRRAEAMLTLARTMRVGESTVSDVMRSAGILRGVVDVRKGVDQYHMPIEKVPVSACASIDCQFLFEPAPWDKHTFISDLQIVFLQAHHRQAWLLRELPKNPRRPGGRVLRAAPAQRRGPIIVRLRLEATPVGLFFQGSAAIFISEVPDDARADEEVALAALVGGHIQLWHTRPEVSYFTAQAELTEDRHIQSQASLEYTCGVPCCARDRGRASTEMSDSTTETDPWRD